MEQFGRYVVEGEIGRGHWGPVYQASDPLLGRSVAIECFSSLLNGNDQESAAVRQRLLQQVRAVALLSHPHLVTIYEMGDAGTTPFLATELLKGDTLQLRLTKGPLRTERALDILRPVAEALDYAHSKGILHCAVEPKHIFVGAQGLVKLTEFSFVATPGSRRPPAAAGKWLGSPYYMSPEQFRGDALDSRSDQYSLAVTAYESLTGRLPFSAASAQDLMRQVVSEDPPAASSSTRLSVGVDIVLRKAMAKQPDDRFDNCVAFLDALALAINAGDRQYLGGFQLEELLGHGAMGKVYRATDPVMRRPVAIKTIIPDPGAPPEEAALRQQELHREAQHVSKLIHPHIVTIFGFGSEADTSYLVMELIEGVSLEKAMTSGPMEPGRACRIIDQIAEALDYAHSQGILHRDIKPANLLLGEGDQVKITDFGISRNLQGGDASGLTMGTLFYMAPEQINGDRLDARCDEFSLAVTAYRMLTGQFPFYSDSSVAIMGRILLTEPAPAHTVNPDLPPLAGRILQKALSKKREDRYPSCGTFAEALRKAFEPEGGQRILGRFEREREIPSGWIGQVTLARDISLGRRVTIQQIDHSGPVITPEVVAFHSSLDHRCFPGLSISPQAVKNAAMLSHPNIIVVYEVTHDRQMSYTVMEASPEETLETLLAGEIVEPNRVLTILRQAAYGLDYMHQCGILHRNVKPGNMLVFPGDLVKIKDFAISLRMASLDPAEAARDIVGPPSYLSPEECNGQVLTGASDQFALAVTAFRALTGGFPFKAPTLEGLIAQIVLFDPPPSAGMSRHLTPFVDAVFARALSKRPEDRYPSCSEFMVRLSEAVAANSLW